MLNLSPFFMNQIVKAVILFKESGEEIIEIPGMKGIFVTANPDKGGAVIYIRQFDFEGETYYLCQMNPLV